jgi:ABC-type Mn2+/Zn2+ transport system permease subunit
MLATVWHTLADPWTDPILRRALAEVALLGLTGGALGCWIVLYELSYAAESLAHGLFPGLVVAALVGVPLIVGAAGGALVAALAIAAVSRVEALGRDTAVAVVVTGLLGAGALLALSRASPPGLQALLFGDLLGVTDSDLALAAALGAAVLAALALLHGRLLAVGFDRMSAGSVGASPALADAALAVLVAFAILVGVPGLGNLLVLAVLVAPAAASRLLCRRVAPMMALAAALALAAGVGGIYLSRYAGTAAGASVAGVLVLLYLAAATAAAVARVGRAAPHPGLPAAGIGAR